MPQFTDVDEFLDEHLRLPIKGKVYSIPPLSGREGLRAQRLMDLALEAALEQSGPPADPDKPARPRRPTSPTQGLELDDDQEQDFYALVLSRDVLEQMLNDGVTWPTIQRAAQTAFLWNTAGPEAAEARWTQEATAAGKAQRPSPSATGPSRPRAGRNGTRASRKGQRKKGRTG